MSEIVGRCLLDVDTHLLHQETSIHILGDSFSKLVGESQLIVLNVGFKAIIADFVGEMLFQLGEEVYFSIVPRNFFSPSSFKVYTK